MKEGKKKLDKNPPQRLAGSPGPTVKPTFLSSTWFSHWPWKCSCEGFDSNGCGQCRLLFSQRRITIRRHPEAAKARPYLICVVAAWQRDRDNGIIALNILHSAASATHTEGWALAICKAARRSVNSYSSSISSRRRTSPPQPYLGQGDKSNGSLASPFSPRPPSPTAAEK